MDFGDRVRIKDTPESREAGFVGKEGDVYGFTTPSYTSVEVIGSRSNDYALNVCLDGVQQTHWFSEDQLEFIGVNPGQQITIDGVDVKWVRSEEGDWVESKIEPNKNPWWKFWA